MSCSWFVTTMVSVCGGVHTDVRFTGVHRVGAVVCFL